MQQVRIFISSPGDVDDERRRAALVISRLKREFGRFFELMPVLWEYEPMLSSGHFQDIIELPSSTDIFVLILWSRMGTPLPERTAVREYRGLDGRVPVTGTEWEFEEALNAKRTKGTPELLVYRRFAEGLARFSRTEELDRVRQQWEALQRFWMTNFEGADGKFRAAFNRFQTLDEFESQFESHLRELLRRRLPPQPMRLVRTRDTKIEWWSGSPYRGLKTFEPSQAAIFFGRDRATRETTERLVALAANATPCLVVLGASGSGKSSLVRAGLLPNLVTPGVVSGVSTWRHAVVHCGEIVKDPIAGFAAALCRPDCLPELRSTGFDERDLAAQFAGNPALAIVPLRSALGIATDRDQRSQGQHRKAYLVVVLDQLETLFAAPSNLVHAFDSLIAALARSGLVWIIGTLRSDFYHRLVDLPELSVLASGLGQYQLSLPRPGEAEQMIRGPANAAGLQFEVDELTGIGLDATILEAAGRDAASLPLLSFVLDELYYRDVEASSGENNILTFRSYRALGGLEGALASRAQAFVEGLPSELAVALSSLLLSLVEVDEINGSATTRVVRISGIRTKELRDLAARLVEARLAVADGASQDQTLRLPHDSLLTYWTLLSDLIKQHSNFLGIRRRLQGDAATWVKHQQSPDFLLPPGRRLVEAEEVLSARRDDLDPGVVTYIEMSAGAERESLRRELLRSRRVTAVVSLLLLVALAAGAFAWIQKDIAAKALREAQRNYGLAIDQAAGSIELLVDGYDQGSISTKLMQQLIERSKQTVDGLERESDDVTVARVRLFDILSLANVSVGHATSAREFAERALALINGLLARESGNLLWQGYRAVTEERLAEALFWQGDLPAAAERARSGKDALLNLSKGRPVDERLHWEIVLAYQRLGDTLRSQGNISGAIEEYHNWIGYAQALRSRDPANQKWNRAIAFAYQRIGDSLLIQNKAPEAIVQLRLYLKEIAALAAADPQHAVYLEGLAFANQRLGDALFANSATSEALDHYQAYHDFAVKLSKIDSSNLRWQALLNYSYQRIGEVLLKQQRFTEALDKFWLYFSLSTDALARDPINKSLIYDVANANEKLGDALVGKGDLIEAQNRYRIAHELGQQLNTGGTSNETWRKALATSYHRIGFVLRRIGDLTGALQQLRGCASMTVTSTAWVPRSTWPQDVLENCRLQVIELEGAPRESP